MGVVVIAKYEWLSFRVIDSGIDDDIVSAISNAIIRIVIGFCNESIVILVMMFSIAGDHAVCGQDAVNSSRVAAIIVDIYNWRRLATVNKWYLQLHKL